MSARTYADLDQVVTDLPAARPAMAGPAAKTMVTPPARTNGLAVASLACGIAQFAFGPLATIPAIVLGHMARTRSSTPENKAPAWRSQAWYSAGRR